MGLHSSHSTFSDPTLYLEVGRGLGSPRVFVGQCRDQGCQRPRWPLSPPPPGVGETSFPARSEPAAQKPGLLLEMTEDDRDLETR